MRPKLEFKGYTVFLIECADGTYYSGMCRDLKKKMAQLSLQRGRIFMKFPERYPLKVVFREEHLPFREAFFKHKYLREMTRRLRKKLIEEKKWPLGNTLRKYLLHAD